MLLDRKSHQKDESVNFRRGVKKDLICIYILRGVRSISSASHQPKTSHDMNSYKIAHLRSLVVSQIMILVSLYVAGTYSFYFIPFLHSIVIMKTSFVLMIMPLVQVKLSIRSWAGVIPAIFLFPGLSTFCTPIPDEL